MKKKRVRTLVKPLMIDDATHKRLKKVADEEGRKMYRMVGVLLDAYAHYQYLTQVDLDEDRGR